METSLAPWLTVRDASRAVLVYSEAFGAEEVYRLDAGDGEVAVARQRIGGSEFWVQAEPGTVAQREGRVRMILTVDDPDAAFERAVAAGAAPVAGVHEEYGWRTGRVTDPFGVQQADRRGVNPGRGLSLSAGSAGRPSRSRPGR